jgi:hypothetical protein
MAIQQKPVDSYCKLRAWLPDATKRADFRILFSKYYGLNFGGFTENWKDKYFDLLFTIDVSSLGDPHTATFKTLYSHKRIKGDNVLAFSFVTKLVAIHDESQPIYDKHVAAFFGISSPSTGSNDFRIAGFLANLKYIRRTYLTWSEDQAYVDILKTLRGRFPSLKNCHYVRLFDFLVWTVGRSKIR